MAEWLSPSLRDREAPGSTPGQGHICFVGLAAQKHYETAPSRGHKSYIDVASAACGEEGVEMRCWVG